MNEKLHGLGCASALAFSGISWVEINNILSTISSIIAIIISLLTLCGLVRKWFKKSMEDGKITEEEVDEGINLISNGLSDIKEHVEECSKKGKENE